MQPPADDPKNIIIIGIDPIEAMVGDDIHITGVGFGETQGSSTLNIGGTPASEITIWSDTEITAIVPDGAITGSVTVNTDGTESNEILIAILWSKQNPENVAICTIDEDQHTPQIISDTRGGAIICWVSQGKDGIFIQHVTNNGSLIHNTNGLAVCADQSQWATIAPDQLESFKCTR